MIVFSLSPPTPHSIRALLSGLDHELKKNKYIKLTVYIVFRTLRHASERA